jgi:hypothetical protein
MLQLVLMDFIYILNSMFVLLAVKLLLIAQCAPMIVLQLALIVLVLFITITQLQFVLNAQVTVLFVLTQLIAQLALINFI